MKTINRTLLSLLALFITFTSFAQGTKTGSADFMRSNGRIYVVIAVVLTILAGLLIYVIRLDRKITRVEKDNN